MEGVRGSNPLSSTQSFPSSSPIRQRRVNCAGLTDAPQVVRRLHAMLDELQATLPSPPGRHAIASQRNLLEAAVSAALPAPFTSVASVADREGLG